MLEIFVNEEDAEARYAYVDNLMLSGLGTIQYELLYDNVLLRLNRFLKEQAIRLIFLWTTRLFYAYCVLSSVKL